MLPCPQMSIFYCVTVTLTEAVLALFIEVTVTVAEPAAISIEGYTFGGWFKDISFENEWNFDNDFVKTDTVLYAKWVSNSGGGNNGATVPVWALTSVIAGSVVFVGAAILLLRRH